jgi:hypothetical protein
MKENKVFGTICHESAIDAFVAQSQRDNVELVVIADEIDISTDMITKIQYHQAQNIDLMVIVADHVALNKSGIPALLEVKWI